MGLLCRLFYLFTMMLMSGWALSESNVPYVVVKGVIEEAHGKVSLFQELNAESLVLPGEYQVNADVRFRAAVKSGVIDQLSLHWQKRELERTVFPFEVGEKETELELLPDSINSVGKLLFEQGSIFTNYDELWIDYRNLVPDNPSRISIQLIVQKGKGEPERALNFSNKERPALVEVGRENLYNLPWMPKKMRYVFSREFGLEHDSNWRYAWEKEKGRVVVQRRFSQNLMSIEALDVVLEDNVALGAINLQLKTADNSNVVMEWGAIPKKITFDHFGRMTVRLLIGSLLDHEFIDQEEVLLTELIIFLSSDSLDIIHNKPIKALRWMARKNIEGAKKAQAPVGELALGNGLTRLQFDLSEDAWWVTEQSRVKSAKLFIIPEGSEQRGGLELDGISLVKISDAPVSTGFSLGRGQLSQWGLVFDEYKRDDGKIIWPVIDAHFPFTEKVTVTDNSTAGWIDINWPVQATMRKGAHIHLGLSSGLERVRNVAVTAFSSGLELGSSFMNPNGSVEIAGEWETEQGVDIDFITFRVFLEPGISNLTVKELVLFRHQYLTPERILEQSLPRRTSDPLFPKKYSNPPGVNAKIHDGGLTLMFPDTNDDTSAISPLTWVTSVDEKNRSVGNFLNLWYQIPPLFLLTDPCWLQLKVLTGMGDQWIRRLCLKNESGHLDISLPAGVEQIEWEILWPKMTALRRFLQNQTFHFAMRLDKLVDRVPVRQLIEMQSLFEWHGQSFFPRLNRLQLLQNSMEVGTIVVNKEETVGNGFYFPEHQWLKLQGLTLSRKQPFTTNEFKYFQLQNNLQSAEEKEGANNILLAAFSLLLLIGLWWLTRQKDEGKQLWVTRGGQVLKEILRKHSSLLFWVSASIILYLTGSYKISGRGENYWFTFGGMAAVMAWRALIRLVRPKLEEHWPATIKKMYGEGGMCYFSGFAVILIIVTVMIALGMERITEQVAVIGYYMLVVGVAREISVLFREKDGLRKGNQAG